jgi:hypothetical protein
VATLDPPYFARLQEPLPLPRRWRVYAYVLESSGIVLPGPIPHPTNPTDLFHPGDMVRVPQRPPRSQARRWRAWAYPGQFAVGTPRVVQRSTALGLHPIPFQVAPPIAHRRWVEQGYPSFFGRPPVARRSTSWLVPLTPPRHHRSRIADAPSFFFNSFLHLKKPRQALSEAGTHVQRQRRATWRRCAVPFVFGVIRAVEREENTPFPGEVQ